ncbi:hypothetical protein P280DRAFT_470384 [Massarina eburnea CBS 473.64]|uniref:Nitroreductase domain-containing protein n=1 Tax=Massarina eburnea CBS 473.64 TaxID=1395130 RepID=A0A6A6RXQ0_9PLEO|nr:hypothetical protein P280DRAFT_470384 [Massarina eburnea CBS 473.64]
MFFDDSSAYDLLSSRFAALAKAYPEWEEHSGMHQFIVWTALSAEGLGVSCQHYQPSITPYVNKTYHVSESWKLKCQLVFGKPVGTLPDAKPKTHLEQALRVYGKESPEA